MIREATIEDLKEILMLYLFLHETNAFVENVVTHKEYRGKGYATDCLNYAREIAQKNNCYKMMLLTGSKEKTTLDSINYTDDLEIIAVAEMGA